MGKKLVITKPGGYGRMEILQHSKPTPKKYEVLVNVKAAGINYADCIIRWGLYESAKKFVGYPITPGFEFAGTIEEVGKDVSQFKIGDKVFGVSLFGAQASQICVNEKQVFPLPEKMNFEESAAFPAVYLTAYHALYQNVVTRPGMKALVHSAAGGVGSALIQLGKHLGLEITGVVGSSHKVSLVKKLGADFVIDKSKENLWSRAEQIAPDGYDLIFDANGFTTLKKGFDHLRSTGKIMSYGFHSMLPKKGGFINPFKLIYGYLLTPRFNPLNLTTQNKSIICFNLSFLLDRFDLLNEAMTDLIKLLREGKIVKPKVTSYNLEDAIHAHKDLESGQTTGKLVLVF